ncbi:MAG: RNA polymerase sigma factor [Rudaea sp.]
MNSIAPAAFPRTLEGIEPDEQSLIRAAHRDPAAFAQHYREYVKPVYAYTLSRVGVPEDARDLTSETFLAALQGIEHFRAESKFSTWLFGIARNKCADYFRRRHINGREVEIDAAERQPAPGPQLDDMVERSARFEELARTARLLPPEQAEALSLRIFGGLTAAQAGQVMGKSEAAVKMLVYRAVRELRTMLGDWAEA